LHGEVRTGDDGQQFPPESIALSGRPFSCARKEKTKKGRKRTKKNERKAVSGHLDDELRGRGERRYGDGFWVVCLQIWM
jgi:hypothetical protein